MKKSNSKIERRRKGSWNSCAVATAEALKLGRSHRAHSSKKRCGLLDGRKRRFVSFRSTENYSVYAEWCDTNFESLQNTDGRNQGFSYWTLTHRWATYGSAPYKRWCHSHAGPFENKKLNPLLAVMLPFEATNRRSCSISEKSKCIKDILSLIFLE